MNEEVTSKAVLKYLNSSNEFEPDGFQSLTTIFEKVIGSTVPHTDSYDVDDYIETKESLRALLDEMVSDGLLDSHWGERDYEANYRITDQGSYEAAGFDQLILDLPTKILTTESGEPITTENGDFIVVNDEADLPASTSVDSSTWTGLPKAGVLSEDAATRLKVVLKTLDHAVQLSGASNEERAQARAYVLAIQALADAPEPPADVIWKIITLGAALSGIGQLFVAVLDLYK